MEILKTSCNVIFNNGKDQDPLRIISSQSGGKLWRGQNAEMQYSTSLSIHCVLVLTMTVPKVTALDK